MACLPLRWLLLVGLSSAGIVGAQGCAALLGIEEATCDESLFADCRSTDPSAVEAGPDNPVDDGGAPSPVDASDAEPSPDASLDPPDAGPIPTAPVPTAPVPTAEPTDDATAPTPDPTEGGSPDAAPPDDGPAPPDDGPEPMPTDDDPPAPTKEELCTEYCDLMGRNCADGTDPERPLLPQYSTIDQCLDVCMAVMRPQAELADPDSRNSIECRIERADDAFHAEPELNCQAASMYGGNFCGTTCEVYCDMRESACAAFIPDAGADCLSECEALSVSTDPFTLSITSGNTAFCRINHIRLAIDSQEPMLHCPHVLGAAPCQ